VSGKGGGWLSDEQCILPRLCLPVDMPLQRTSIIIKHVHTHTLGKESRHNRPLLQCLQSGCDAFALPIRAPRKSPPLIFPSPQEVQKFAALPLVAKKVALLQYFFM